MNKFVKRKLKKIIIKYGTSICEQPKRLKGLLNDLCPASQQENFVLLTALSQNIVEDLLKLKSDQLYQIKAGKFKKKLIDNCGITKDLASWAVDSWAFALGIIDAQDSEELYKLGENFFSNGDYKKAVIYFKKSADLGSAKGQKALGYMYQNGWKDKLNYKETTDWYRRAAVKWYKKAAIQGEADAQTILGSIYKRGWGVKKNYKKALGWYKKAAQQGHEFAQYNLGYMYQQGLGIKQDHQQAQYWYQKAARQGNDFAQQALKDFSKQKLKEKN